MEGPVYAGTNLDIPALPPSIGGLIERASATAPVILDLGGDDAGGGGPRAGTDWNWRLPGQAETLRSSMSSTSAER